MTDKEIREYIRSKCIGISFKDIWKIRERFIYDNIDLDEAINDYLKAMKI